MNLFSNYKISKTRLDALVKLLVTQNYAMYYTYKNGKMTLSICRHEEFHCITFNIKGNPHHTHYTYHDSKITTLPMNGMVNKHLGLDLTFDHKQSNEDVKVMELKTSKQIKMEIDYYLMELHEHIKENNTEKADGVKNLLQQLSRQLNDCT